METINGVMWVALGSVLGGMARFWLSGFVARRVGETFPWGTMVINVSGAFLIGVLAASAAGHGTFAEVRPWQFAVTGFLGCYTTVSSFSLQTLSLARDSEMSLAAWNMVLSLSLCLLAVAVGFTAGAPRVRVKGSSAMQDNVASKPPATEQRRGPSASRQRRPSGGKNSGIRPVPIFPSRSAASSEAWRVIWFPSCS